MSDFVNIELKTSVIVMSFGVAIPTDNNKTTISISFIKSVSISKIGVVIVTLEDGRTWELSVLPELIDGTYPIDKWNGESVSTSNELFNKIENIIL